MSAPSTRRSPMVAMGPWREGGCAPRASWNAGAASASSTAKMGLSFLIGFVVSADLPAPHRFPLVPRTPARGSTSSGWKRQVRDAIRAHQHPQEVCRKRDRLGRRSDAEGPRSASREFDPGWSGGHQSEYLLPPE